MASENILPTLQALLATRGVHPDPDGSYCGYILAYGAKQERYRTSLQGRWARAVRAFFGEDCVLGKPHYLEQRISKAWKAFWDLY